MSAASVHLQTFFAKAAWWLVFAAPSVAAGAFLLAILALLILLNTRRRLKRLMLGKNGSLEETLTVLSRDIQEMQSFRAELEKYLKFSETRLRGSISGVGLVRFNPFEGQGQGGNQSFAAALLDEEGHGVVFSTLYARDRAFVYAKPIENGASSFELSNEEKEALAKAKSSILRRKK